jgi:hypothetical protein
MSEIVNVKATSTFIGKEDHGVFTIGVELSGSGIGIMYGGYGYTNMPEYHVLAMIELIRVFDVAQWEKIPGKFCRAKLEGSRVVAVGHLIEDIWFSFDNYREDAKAGVRKVLK